MTTDQLQCPRWLLAIAPAFLCCAVVDTQGSAGLITVRQRENPATVDGPAPGSVTTDGRLVAFTSLARLDPADTDDSPDLYTLEVETGRVVLESRRPGWANRYSSISYPRISDDGRFIVFQAFAEDARHDQEYQWQVVRLDRRVAAATLVSVDRTGRPANGHCTHAAISADGRTVAFTSSGTNLVAGGDANGSTEDIYLAQEDQRGVSRINVGNTGAQPPSGYSVTPAVSADGRYVAFTSMADLTCSGSIACPARSTPRTRRTEVYVHDTFAGITFPVSRPRGGRAPNGHASWPSISGDGRYVAFASEGSNLVTADDNRQADVFVHDRLTGAISLVSRRRDGRPGDGASRHPSISRDGGRVAFQSLASDLVCGPRCRPGDGELNMLWDVFLFDRLSEGMVRVSGDGAEEWMEPSRGPALNGAGNVVIFASPHPIHAGDDGYDEDLYVRTIHTIERATWPTLLERAP